MPPLRQLAFLSLFLVLGCSDTPPPARTLSAPTTLDDFGADAAPLLRRLPHVVEVERQGAPGRPTQRIIILRDWHYVHPDDFASDQRTLDATLVDEEIARRYAEHLDDVDRIQTQEMELLRALAADGVGVVYVEGISKEDRFIYDATVSVARKYEADLRTYRAERKRLAAVGDTAQVDAKLVALEATHREHLLKIGAAGRLLIENRPINIGPNRKVVIDPAKNDAREEAQARIVLAGPPLVVVVVGGSHDLGTKLAKLSQGKAECFVVTLAAWKNVSGEP